MRKKMKLSLLCRRYSDGGAAGGIEPTPAPAPVTLPAAEPPVPANPADPAVPADPATEAKPAEAAKSFTQQDMDTAVQTALTKFKQEQENAKDFDKMTPEQKVTYLQAQMADKALSESAVKKLGEAGLPTDFVALVKGKDEADTEARIQTLKNQYDSAVQAGVEKRFKDNGYTPPANSDLPVDISKAFDFTGVRPKQQEK